MKKDIDFVAVTQIHVAIVKSNTEWKAYLLNRSDDSIENILITSRGYGQKDGVDQKTSVLRHVIHSLESKGYALIERIEPAVFHLHNEYWVSYYINGQIYDKKFIFLPDSISEDHLTTIAELDLKGILHD